MQVMPFEKQLSDGVALFLLGPEHTDEYFALIDSNRQRLRKWFCWVDETKTTDDTRVFAENARKRWAERSGVVAGIRCEGRMAGVVAVENVDMRHETAHLLYLLDEEYEGKGLVAQACKALLDCAFGDFGLNRIELRICPSNERSRNVALRLGFQYEGTLRQAAKGSDGYEDHEVYSMLKAEWAARRPEVKV